MGKHICPGIWTGMFCLMGDEKLSPGRVAGVMGVGVSTVYKKLRQHRGRRCAEAVKGRRPAEDLQSR